MQTVQTFKNYTNILYLLPTDLTKIIFDYIWGYWLYDKYKNDDDLICLASINYEYWCRKQFSKLPKDLRTLIFEYVYRDFKGCVACGNENTHWLPSCEKCNRGLCKQCHEQYKVKFWDQIENNRKQCDYCVNLCEECIEHIINSFETKQSQYRLCNKCNAMCDICKSRIKEEYDGCITHQPEGHWHYRTLRDHNGNVYNRLCSCLEGGWLCECHTECKCRPQARALIKIEMNLLRCIQVEEVYDKNIDYAVGLCTDCLLSAGDNISSNDHNAILF